MKLKKPPIDVFDNWVKIGKDDGLEKNHASAVSKMVEYSTSALEKFSFIDAGCGNGWLVRNLSISPLSLFFIMAMSVNNLDTDPTL
ncbi:MAG: hypothetical protein CBC56_002660 [Flavobacteriales bacterium TMED96]|nr:MAG: hypothetical protein CBC56_002660 [Flavobacteriales bacterium TMED96]